MDEGAFGRFHLRAGVVQSLTAPHNRTQRFLQRAVQLRLVQPEEENEQCGQKTLSCCVNGISSGKYSGSQFYVRNCQRELKH